MATLALAHAHAAALLACHARVAIAMACRLRFSRKLDVGEEHVGVSPSSATTAAARASGALELLSMDLDAMLRWGPGHAKQAGMLPGPRIGWRKLHRVWLHGRQAPQRLCCLARYCQQTAGSLPGASSSSSLPTGNTLGAAMRRAGLPASPD